MIPCGKSSGESRRTTGFPANCILLGLVTLVLAGCATRGEILRLKEDAAYIRATTDTLNQTVQSLRDMVEDLQVKQDRLVEEMATQSDVRQFRAYLSSRLDDDQAQANMLSDQVNDLSQRLTGVAQRVDEMKYRAKEPSIVDTSAAAEMVDAEPRQLYDQAYLDLSRGSYDLAKTGFDEYLKRYPDTELADNALYWLGEVEYGQHNYKIALEKFQQVEVQYPKGNKVAAALLKMGLCQIQLRQKISARETFRKLVDKYPSTPEAAQAKERLKSLK